MFKKTKQQVHLFKVRYYCASEWQCFYAESSQEAIDQFKRDNLDIDPGEPIVIVDCGIMKDPDDRE